jgi:branched-chain amino acid transport system ATP-binding protein
VSAVLEVSDLKAGYGRVEAVRGVSIRVEQGKVVGLLGRNGAGKSTTLLTLSGLVKPRGGEVRVSGVALKGGKPHLASRAGLTQVPEDRALFTQLTVRENLAVAGARSKAHLREVFDMFPELEPLIDRRGGLLSGGEQQMLVLARALQLKPKVLLIDEMSLGLAPVICARLAQVVRKVADDHGMAVLLVEQHLSLALDVADYGYVMNKGEIVIEGTRDVLAARRHEVESSYMGGLVSED